MSDESQWLPGERVSGCTKQIPAIGERGQELLRQVPGCAGRVVPFPDKGAGLKYETFDGFQIKTTGKHRTLGLAWEYEFEVINTPAILVSKTIDPTYPTKGSFVWITARNLLASLAVGSHF